MEAGDCPSLNMNAMELVTEFYSGQDRHTHNTHTDTDGSES